VLKAVSNGASAWRNACDDERSTASANLRAGPSREEQQAWPRGAPSARMQLQQCAVLPTAGRGGECTRRGARLRGGRPMLQKASSSSAPRHRPETLLRLLFRCSLAPCGDGLRRRGRELRAQLTIRAAGRSARPGHSPAHTRPGTQHTSSGSSQAASHTQRRSTRKDSSVRPISRQPAPTAALAGPLEP
jgi:hypothetical protein